MDYLEIEVYYKPSFVEFTYYLSLMGTNPPTIRDRNSIDEITIWTLKDGKWFKPVAIEIDNRRIEL